MSVQYGISARDTLPVNKHAPCIGCDWHLAASRFVSDHHPALREELAVLRTWPARGEDIQRDLQARLHALSIPSAKIVQFLELGSYGPIWAVRARMPDPRRPASRRPSRGRIVSRPCEGMCGPVGRARGTRRGLVVECYNVSVVGFTHTNARCRRPCRAVGWKWGLVGRRRR